MRNFLKRLLVLLFFFDYSASFAQADENGRVIIKARDYAFLDEEIAIKYFDIKYEKKTIDSVDEPTLFFSNKKYAFINNMLIKHHVKPKGYLEYLYPVNFVCGVGMKRQKDVSPACKEVKIYQSTPEGEKILALAKIIIQQGEKPDNYAFDRAVRKNDFALFKIYLEANNNQLPEKDACESMFLTAVDLGHYDFVKFFLEKGVSPNTGADFYAIYRAVSYPEIFFLLIDNGADYKVVGYKQTTTIDHTAREGCTEVMQFLLDKGMDPFEKHGNMTAIEMAEKYNEKNGKEMVKLMKKYKK